MNPNLLVWTSDWHVVSNDSESGIVGDTKPTDAQAVVAHLNSLEPYGCFDTGDIKDHYGATGTADEHDNYITYVGNALDWIPLNSGFNAAYPTLPGNHDEFYDYTSTPPGGNDDFAATFDTKFWGPPYRWTADWPAARVRIIAFHAYIHHTGTGIVIDEPGFFHVTSAELAWLTAELAALPPGWQAIVCCHPPAAPAHNPHIRYTDDTYTYATNAILPLLQTYADRVVCHLSGHRHLVWTQAAVSGVQYVTCSGVAYSSGNAAGIYTTITHDSAARTLTFDVRYATGASIGNRYAGFTPVEFDLPAFSLARGRAGLTPSTSSAARILTGAAT